MRSTSEAARLRVLAASRAEFAANGFAGARVDRISAEAGASKERLYAYFGSKEALWIETVTQELVELDAIGDVASLDGAAIVGRLFDAFVADPVRLRFFFWQLVEAEGPADIQRLALQERKIAAIEQAQTAGAIASRLPADIVVRLLISVAASCAQEYLRDPEDASRREATRAAAIAVGAAILEPA